MMAEGIIVGKTKRTCFIKNWKQVPHHLLHVSPYEKMLVSLMMPQLESDGLNLWKQN
jgi:hypothetical protein